MDDEKRNAEILASAKKIMDTFFETLSKTTVETESFGLKREKQLREPISKGSDETFKQKILSNASNKNQDYILAEKKSW